MAAEIAAALAQERTYQLKIYAQDVFSGKNTLHAEVDGELREKRSSYEVRVEMPALEPGLYHLLTMLQGPSRLYGHFQGPGFQVRERQPAPAEVQEAPG